jgi:hypothetical protein
VTHLISSLRVCFVWRASPYRRPFFSLLIFGAQVVFDSRLIGNETTITMRCVTRHTFESKYVQSLD